jgi:hypothetical protein
MATTLAPAINFTNVSKGMKSLNTGVENLKNSSDSIKTVTLNRTKIKRESFARDKILTNMREEAVRRKDQESIIESSGIGGAMRRSTSVIADSTKGFLGRILDFASSLLIGWLLYNLPTIMTAIENLITRITSLTQLLRDFISNITNTFENFGSLLSGVYQNVTQFDFTDKSKRVQSAMDDLNINLETMRDQFMQGFDILNKPLGEGPGEEPVPELNTDYTQDGPTTGGGAPPSPAGASAGFARVYETARKVGDQFPEVTAAQWQLESGGGKKLTGKNNPFGQTGDPKTQKGRWLNVPEGGKKYFLDFDSEEEAIRYRLNRWGYKYGNAATPEQAVKNIQLPGGTKIPGTNDVSHGIYATDPEYVSKVTRIIKEQGGNPQRQRSSGPAPAMTPKPSSSKGGKVVEYITGDRTHKRYAADHGGRNYHDHVAFDSQATRDSAMKWLRSRGWTIGSIDTGKHANGSFHYSNQAFDIPFYSGNNTKKGVTDDAKGETKLSSMLRADLIAGGFGGPQLGGSSIAPAPSAQVSSTSQPGQNVPSVAQNRRGQQIIIADNPQQPQPQQVSAGGGRSQPQMIPIESSLNSLIKNQILLELAYT